MKNKTTPDINAIKKLIDASRIYDLVKHTKCHIAAKKSHNFGANIYIKREDLQPVHSFKIRGAYNKISQLDQNQRNLGVITASAGNHAQGVALSAQKLGLKAKIVMPRTTPEIKQQAVRGYGADIVLHGDNYSEAAEHCQKLVNNLGMIYIPPFDDIDVIAGQGTIGAEIFQDIKDIDTVFIAVGGGGLIAGVGAYLKAINPNIKIIGVEPEDSQCMAKSLQAGKVIELNQVGIFADGVAVKRPGKITFEIAKQVVDEMITVSTDQVCAAIKDIFEETRVVVEPAGALSMAGLNKYAQTNDVANQTLVTINCGANISFERLRFVAERTLAGSGREVLYAIHLPERPGALADFCSQIVKDRSITEFNYRIADPLDAVIFVGVEVIDDQDRTELEASMVSKGYFFTSLVQNELAKEHIRYMIGGKGQEVSNEVLLRVDFPERPGALSDFLKNIGESWNISLFHYRAIGGDLGRVLIGFEVETKDVKDFMATIDKTHYPFEDVSGDQAYQIFLR